MFKFVKLRYQLKKITAAQVWEYADNGTITAEEATKICGPRPVLEA